MKIPLTPAGIEPATFRFVAQRLNHCATAVLLKGSDNTIVVSLLSHGHTGCRVLGDKMS